MSIYTKARRAALLFLLLVLSLAGTVVPASAMYAEPGGPADLTPPAPPTVHDTDVVTGSDPGLVPWLLIGIAAALILIGVALTITRRYRRMRSLVLSS